MTSAASALRIATPADVGAIVALVESAYRGDASRQGWTTEADLLDGRRTDAVGVMELIERPDSVVLLLGPPDDLIACAHLARVRGTDHDAAYFGMFSVRPDAQGTGIGARVLNEAERIVRDDWRCPEMHMTVISIRDDLIPWYERRGYRRTGVYKPFPYGDTRFGIPKRNDLRFEVLAKTL